MYRCKAISHSGHGQAGSVCYYSLNNQRFTPDISADVQRRWNETRELIGRIVDLVQGGLKIIHVKPGFIVVPGLAGVANPLMSRLCSSFRHRRTCSCS
jgi:hypothetical protein